MADVTGTLHEDHQKVERLFGEIKQTADGAEDKRRELCKKIVDELKAHTEFEESIFYPAVRSRDPSAADLVDSAMEEHSEVDDLLQKIEAMDVGSEDFMATVSDLEQAVQAHVQREEEEIFPIAKSALEDDESEQMSERHDEIVQQQLGAGG